MIMFTTTTKKIKAVLWISSLKKFLFMIVHRGHVTVLKESSLLESHNLDHIIVSQQLNMILYAEILEWVATWCEQFYI